METVSKTPILIYTEQTPNPESLKYVTNRMLFKGTADFESAEDASAWSPLATELFSLPYVRRVYICNNFITVSKELNYAWEDIMLPLKEEIKRQVDQGTVAIQMVMRTICARRKRNSLPSCTVETMNRWYSASRN
jgi:NFU1 iron-sulfur cluster scaffold homolog, mitochondrial